MADRLFVGVVADVVMLEDDIVCLSLLLQQFTPANFRALSSAQQNSAIDTLFTALTLAWPPLPGQLSPRQLALQQVRRSPYALCLWQSVVSSMAEMSKPNLEGFKSFMVSI